MRARVFGRIGGEGERWEGDIRVIGVVGAIGVVGRMGEVGWIMREGCWGETVSSE